MFNIVNATTSRKGHPSIAHGCHVFTCSVGRKPSRAQYFVEDEDSVLTTLQALAAVSEEIVRPTTPSMLGPLSISTHNLSTDLQGSPRRHSASVG